MLSWQRHLRLALGAFVLLFAIGLVVALRQSSTTRVSPAVSVPKADPKAVAQSNKGRFVLSKGSQLDVVVEYEQSFTYSDNSSKLVGVVARLPQRSGRDFTVKAREGRTTQGQEDLTLQGAVEITSNDGLVLRTDAASYTKGADVMKAPGAVAFSRGRMSGTSNGMTYEQGTDVLALLDKAVIHLAPDDQGQGGADIESGRAVMARREKNVQFTGGVKIVRGGQTTTADEATAYLTDDEKSVKLFALRGSARVAGAPGTAGGLKSMAARDIDLNYSADGQKLEHAVLTAGAAIELAGTSDANSRRLAGEWIEVGLGADGATVTALTARERVQLDLPADGTTPARVIRAAQLQSSGQEGKGLTAATFIGDPGQVEFRETPAPPANPRLARSATMELAMQGGFSTIESARFTGGVRFEEGDMAAVSREARYVLAKGVLSLAGDGEKTRQPPRVVDEQTTIQATRIEIGLDGRRISASDNVKSDLKPKKQPEAGARPAPGGQAGVDKGQTRLPSMLKQDQPVSATADNLQYDGGASHAVYTGHARLWQGDTTIKADRIVLDDQKGDLSASGSVVTNMTLEQVNDKTKAKERVRSIATAQDMVYQDDVRRATYTTRAHLNGPQGDLAADKIELYLKENGSEVDRLEAYTAVTLTTPEKRKATGVRLTYFSADERYVMNGTPVKIVEECRETIGKTLTFFRSADRIIVDGNEQKRTETKGASACGSGPRTD